MLKAYAKTYQFKSNDDDYDNGDDDGDDDDDGMMKMTKIMMTPNNIKVTTRTALK